MEKLRRKLQKQHQLGHHPPPWPRVGGGGERDAAGEDVLKVETIRLICLEQRGVELVENNVLPLQGDVFECRTGGAPSA